jgi:hypothetical protein
MASNRSPLKDRQRLTNRQLNLLLELLVVAAITSGLVSWVVPLAFARLATLVHAVSGLTILVVAPLKLQGPVRAGFRRRRPTRWVSAGFGVAVLITIALGAIHASGIWTGIGYWSALWTHQLVGFTLIPLLIWHVTTRPVRPSLIDVDRRGFLATAVRLGVAAAVVGGQEVSLRALRLEGADRAGTGSHDVGSFDPDRMPTVQWIDDSTPRSTEANSWDLIIAGQRTEIAAVRAATKPLTARLDCTGGWYADQKWDVVSLSDLLPAGAVGRSVEVTSATGYKRLFPMSKVDEIFVATGYDGRPLRRGHGAPLRLVAPGRRGPWWVKWVTSIEPSGRPSWLQLPLPPT